MLLFILYFIVIVFLLYIWILWYKKYSKGSGIFLFFASICWAIRFFSYLLIYAFLIDKDILLYIFRLMYVMSLFWFYSMILFIYNFWKKIKKRLKILYVLLFLTIFSVFLLTPLVVSNLKYVINENYFFEDYGQIYDYIILLYLFLIFIFIFVSYFKLNKLTYINNARLKIVVFWFSSFMVLSIFFYLFLPYFWFFFLENLWILFLVPFIFSVSYSINTYNFINIKISIWKIILFLFSLVCSLFSLYLSKYTLTNFWDKFQSFWNISENIWFFDLILFIIFFLLYNKFFWKIFFINSSLNYFENKLFSLKKNIPYISNLDKMNKFLESKFNLLFKIQYVKIRLFDSKSIKSELYNYFSKDISLRLFINDIVFIEENKHKFKHKKLKKELNEKVHLIFPMFNNKKKLIWIFEVWKKPFKEQFYSQEIEIIKSFLDFIVGHLKYIEIYSHINDLNINLDKKVDEQTIKFNKLINKQKEFISMSSHEIKTPVMSASLQIESFLDDIKSWSYDKKYLIDEAKLLEEQILKISQLVKNIFSVQKYDLKDVWLYIEKINIVDIFIVECEILQRIHPWIKFDIDISKSIWFVNLDKVQFTQVISNLLNNAIKFAWYKQAIIKIKLTKSWDYIKILIEDNWSWFDKWELKDIFDKYSTWKGKSVWIWMWLYLCKKIVELHGGVIEAWNSKSLWWAKFKILIPKKIKK